jgi:autotransporter family porin
MANRTGATSTRHLRGRRIARAALAVGMAGALWSCTAPPQVAPKPQGSSSHFGTLPPGSALPSDAQCRQRVRPAAENRPGTRVFNQTTGHETNPDPALPTARRITGNYTGTTDQIIQWVACKWGIDENVVRAQVAIESWWHQTATGDFTTNPAHCAPRHPIGADGRAGMCPESIGLGQVRTQYFRAYISDAVASSAYNLDVTYAVWRSCFEGHETWLNTVERGRQYAKGDLWGCVGRWFSGRWHTAAATEYIGRVQSYLRQRIWTTPNFANG